MGSTNGVRVGGPRRSGLKIVKLPGRVPVVRVLMLTAAMALVAAAPLPAQKKEIIQLQRDMAILQEQVRETGRQITQLSERMAVFENLLQQNLDTSTKLHQAVALIERSLAKQADAMIGPITTISMRIDSLTSRFGAVREAVEEMNSRLGKVQQQVEDIKNQVSTLPPSGMEDAGGGALGGGTSSETLFNSALTDYHRGTFESAEPQFEDYLRMFPSTVRASEAQYYLGDISYQQEDFDQAVKRFDRVLEQFPVGLISADAQFKKAMALLKLDRGADARREFQSVVDKFPNSNVAPAAEAQIERIGGGAR